MGKWMRWWKVSVTAFYTHQQTPRPLVGRMDTNHLWLSWHGYVYIYNCKLCSCQNVPGLFFLATMWHYKYVCRLLITQLQMMDNNYDTGTQLSIDMVRWWQALHICNKMFVPFVLKCTWDSFFFFFLLKCDIINIICTVDNIQMMDNYHTLAQLPIDMVRLWQALVCAHILFKSVLRILDLY